MMRAGEKAETQHHELYDRISDDVDSGLNLKELVERYEREILTKMLEKNGGNVRKTAAAQLRIRPFFFLQKDKRIKTCQRQHNKCCKKRFIVII